MTGYWPQDGRSRLSNEGHHLPDGVGVCLLYHVSVYVVFSSSLCSVLIRRRDRLGMSWDVKEARLLACVVEHVSRYSIMI